MQTLNQIKALLDERGIAPKRSLGQNFLVDQNLVRKLVDAAGVATDDLVLEVGPGTGTLTEELLARGCRVVASELDDSLAAMLVERAPTLPGGERLTVVHGDCLAGKHELAPAVVEALQQNGPGLPTGPHPFTLVANLPYGAATPLLSTLLMSHPECPVMAVTVQKEAADRVMARPRTKEYGPLAVITQALCEVQKIATLRPECFWPRPDVTSAMVILRRRASPLTDDIAGLSAACRRVFAHRRKQIQAAVKGIPLPEGIRPAMRAEELTVQQLIALARSIQLVESGSAGLDSGARIG